MWCILKVGTSCRCCIALNPVGTHWLCIHDLYSKQTMWSTLHPHLIYLAWYDLEQPTSIGTSWPRFMYKYLLQNRKNCRIYFLCLPDIKMRDTFMSLSCCIFLHRSLLPKKFYSVMFKLFWIIKGTKISQPKMCSIWNRSYFLKSQNLCLK